MNRIEVSVVAFQEGDLWVAQCVEYDIAAHASELTKLHAALERAVMENVCVNMDLGREGLEGIPAAPARFRDLFDGPSFDLRRRQAARENKSATVKIRDLRVVEAA